MPPRPCSPQPRTAGRTSLRQRDGAPPLPHEGVRNGLRSLRLGLRNRHGLYFVRVPVAKQVPVRLGSIAAGDRNVELRIAPHAVLRDVEAGGLGLLLDADPPK